MTKEHRTTQEEMEGETSSLGSRNRKTRPTLQEHDDDDDDGKRSRFTDYNFNSVET